MFKIKTCAKRFWEKITLLPTIIWLLILIFLPINFFCLKEKLNQKDNLSSWELAFNQPNTQITVDKSLKELTEFYLSTQSEQKKNCQVETFFENKKIAEQKITLKKEKRFFSLPETALKEISLQPKGKLEILLHCDNYQDSIYKYLTF